MVHLRVSYYPDITQGRSPAEVHAAVDVFSQALSVELSRLAGVDVTVTTLGVLQVPAQFREFVEGKHEIALLKPVAYVRAHARNAAIVPACVAHRVIDGREGVEYFGQIYARSEFGFGSIADLVAHGAGRLRIAYGDRFSTSNFLIPAALLRKVGGIQPFTFFRETIFAGGHDHAAELVYSGKADVGAGHDGVIKMLRARHPDAEKVLVQVGRENIHSDPVAVNSGVLPKPITVEMCAEAGATVSRTREVQAALDVFWGEVKALSPTSHGKYASIVDALDVLALTERDILE